MQGSAGMAQEVGGLVPKHKALSSNPSPTPPPKKIMPKNPSNVSLKFST
jgi:hypothetical protein